MVIAMACIAAACMVMGVVAHWLGYKRTAYILMGIGSACICYGLRLRSY